MFMCSCVCLYTQHKYAYMCLRVYTKSMAEWNAFSRYFRRTRINKYAHIPSTRASTQDEANMHLCLWASSACLVWLNYAHIWVHTSACMWTHTYYLWWSLCRHVLRRLAYSVYKHVKSFLKRAIWACTPLYEHVRSPSKRKISPRIQCPRNYVTWGMHSL